MMISRKVVVQDVKIIKILRKVYKNFKQGNFKEAITILENAINIDFEHREVVFALKCASFWQERKNKLPEMDYFHRGEYLLEQWESFCNFILNAEKKSEQCIYSLKQHVFGTALENYMRLYEPSGINDFGILYKIGKINKSLGNYDRAIEILENANQLKRNEPKILVELADCYALVNETKAAKVFFKEAFFLDPQAIDISTIESMMIKKLIKKLKTMGYVDTQINEWIPVYGIILGIFNIKRELTPVEIGRIKQTLLKLEKDYVKRETGKNKLPRILFNYFMLMDHYLFIGENKDEVDNILLKIRELSPEIYEKYVN